MTQQKVDQRRKTHILKIKSLFVCFCIYACMALALHDSMQYRKHYDKLMLTLQLVPR